MTNLSQRDAGPADNPTALASEWIVLNSGCEGLMSYEEWCDRKTAAAAYCDTWTEAERTEFSTHSPNKRARTRGSSPLPASS